MPKEEDRAGREVERQRLLELTYEADVKGVDPRTLLLAGDSSFVRTRIVALGEHQREVDELIAAHVVGWSFDRLAPVDRAILRIATTELLTHVTPAPVAIAEAVKLADRFSTERSPAFVNGVLAGVATAIAGPEDTGPT